MTKTTKAAVCVLLLSASCAATAQPPSQPAASSAQGTDASPLFTFETDEL